MPIDMTAAVSAPPRKSSGTRASKPKTVSTDTRSNYEKRQDGLNGIAQLIQGGLVLTSQWADAAAIGRFAPPIARELALLSDTNETIAKPVDFLIQIGPYGALIEAVLPLALQIAANHRMVDASALTNMGVVPPQVLEAQMKAEVMRMQAEALREQQQAIADANAAQLEYEKFMAAQQVLMEDENASVPVSG